MISDNSRNFRLIFKFFYSAAGDTQEDSGLEIEFTDILGVLPTAIPNHYAEKYISNEDIFTTNSSYDPLGQHKFHL